MTERAKRCGTCGAWEPTWRSGGYSSIKEERKLHGPARGECRRTHEIFIERDEHKWCLDWLPRGEGDGGE